MKFWINISLTILIVIIIYFIIILFKMDTESSTKIIAMMITVFSGLLGIIYTQTQIKQREIDESHRERKIKIYQSFLKLNTAVFQGENKDSDNQPPTEKEKLEFFSKFYEEILLWGSPEVIKVFLEFKYITSDEDSGMDTLIVANKLYKAFRKDIGLSNSSLHNCELIKLFIHSEELYQLKSNKCF